MFLSTVAEAWIVTKLLGDATVIATVGVQISRSPAPEDWAPPFVVFRRASGRDMAGIGQPVDASSFLYDVAVLTEGHSAAGIEAAANALDDAIDGREETFTGYAITCGREGELPEGGFSEREQVFQRIGGEYRILVSKP